MGESVAGKGFLIETVAPRHATPRLLRKPLRERTPFQLLLSRAFNPLTASCTAHAGASRLFASPVRPAGHTELSSGRWRDLPTAAQWKCLLQHPGDPR